MRENSAITPVVRAALVIAGKSSSCARAVRTCRSLRAYTPPPPLPRYGIFARTGRCAYAMAMCRTKSIEKPMMTVKHIACVSTFLIGQLTRWYGRPS